jgi:hypothetical protein
MRMKKIILTVLAIASQAVAVFAGGKGDTKGARAILGLE